MAPARLRARAVGQGFGPAGLGRGCDLVRRMSFVLVTGGSGQLATALAKASGDALHVVGRPVFDFDKAGTLDALFAKDVPELVINAAAWTAVDLAEMQPDAVRRANADGPARLALLCQRHGTK